MSVHDSFWSYRNRRWPKLTAALVATSVVAFAAIAPPAGRGGNTWVGYGLGTLCLALMLWLAWFGVRKRSYRPSGAPLRGWLSAHVWLGLALVVLIPLHGAGQLGWNLHAAAFWLTMLVVVSGLAGAAFYGIVPERITANRPGEKLASLLERVVDLDTECRTIAVSMPDDVARAVAASIENTRVGGSALRLLRGREPRCATRLAHRTLAERLPGLSGAARDEAQKLVELLDHKRSLLARIRRDLRLNALLRVWLYAHVPLAAAALAAVAAHVLVVSWYR